MKPNPLTKKWIPLALLGTALAYSSGAAVPDILLPPDAIQPGGDSNDASIYWARFWADTGTVIEEFDSSMHSSNNIAGSIHVIFDCQGGQGQDPSNIKSANLAFGNHFSRSTTSWLGDPALIRIDASKYESVTLDINVVSQVSSNTAIPFCLFGAGYANVNLTNFPITTPGWQHVTIPIPAAINLADCVSFGVYAWYNTTASTPPAHVEFWMSNVKLVARKIITPPPTVSLASTPGWGLMFDSGLGEGGARGSIDTIGDMRWLGVATPDSPVTYSMTVGWVPDPAVYSNFEAHIFLAPSAGVGSPDWNAADMGYLQVLNHSDGTATARMMWKTNEAFGNTMLFNNTNGGEYGTNGYPAGTLGYLDAPTMLGTWSISFTSDTDFVVRGPGGVSTNLSLPTDWVNSYNTLGGMAYAYFGGSPNSGQPMFLSQVSITGGMSQYALTNNFSTLPLDTATWGLLGNQTLLVPPGAGWALSWTLPAANFNLLTTADLAKPISWVQLSGNTNLPVPVTTYTSGTNAKAYVAVADLSKADRAFFALHKVVVAKLQVLMPGETNAPGTATGKGGTPDPQPLGSPVAVTVNAVDADWNVVTYSTDKVSITSSDSTATSDTGNALPLAGQLVQGTATFNIVFMTASSQTVTATDTSETAVTANTGSSTTITP